MKNILDDIKRNTFKPVYFLYGEEGYLINQYKNKLISAIVGDNTFNLTVVNDKPDERALKELINTPPFMSERRLIVIDRCDLLKTSDKYLFLTNNLPEYIVIIIIENTLDKRLKLYKEIKKIGYICEMKTQSEASVSKFIKGKCDEEGKRTDPDTIREIYRRTCGDLGLIVTELEKLFSYTDGRDVITMSDVRDIVSVRIEEKVFDMIDAIAYRDKRRALSLYYDLLAVRESPMKIMILMERHFNGLLQVKSSPPMPAGDLAKSIGLKGVAPFVAGRYQKQAVAFSKERLKELVEEFMRTEEDIKTGMMSDKTGAELMIAEALL